MMAMTHCNKVQMPAQRWLQCEVPKRDDASITGNDTSTIVVMLTVKLCQGRHCRHGLPLCMTGNCAMDGRFAFNAEVNIAKVGNFAKDGNVATKGQQINLQSRLATRRARHCDK